MLKERVKKIVISMMIFMILLCMVSCAGEKKPKKPKCKVKDCVYYSMDGGDYCPAHTCSAPECFEEVDKSFDRKSDLCLYHWIYRNLEAGDSFPFTTKNPDEICYVNGCENDKSSKGIYCYEHICHKSECKKRRYSESEYCKSHTCYEKGCFNGVDSANERCSVHRAAYYKQILGEPDDETSAQSKPPASSAAESKPDTSKPSSSGKGSVDRFHASDYDSFEDFYEDYYDDFDGIDDAEDYWDKFHS